MFSGWDEYHLINEELKKLAGELPASDLGEIINYVLTSPGKRARPLILVLSCRAFGGLPRKSINAAMAVELVHAASLVHDDILDCGVERRGEPSIFERYGTDAALLCGDYLISKSIELMSGYSQPVIKAFARACMDMSDGEMLDLSSACSAEEYYRCISKKTASLFAASARIGCLIASAGQDDTARLESYGLNLGLAYQIMDDLEEYLGIDQGKSSQKASATLPRIYREHHCEDESFQLCMRAINDHCSMASKALAGAKGDEKIKARLQEILDHMVNKGLEECRSPRNLC